MKITITRLDATDRGIFGHLTLDSGPFNCVTLENHVLSIPEGIYPITMYASPDHGMATVPLLHNVPGRSFVEIHWGNWEKDSKGCILVGSERDGWAIDSSQEAFNDLMTQLKGCNDISVEIK